MRQSNPSWSVRQAQTSAGGDDFSDVSSMSGSGAYDEQDWVQSDTAKANATVRARIEAMAGGSAAATGGHAFIVSVSEGDANGNDSSSGEATIE